MDNTWLGKKTSPLRSEIQHQTTSNSDNRNYANGFSQGNRQHGRATSFSDSVTSSKSRPVSLPKLTTTASVRVGSTFSEPASHLQTVSENSSTRYRYSSERAFSYDTGKDQFPSHDCQKGKKYEDIKFLEIRGKDQNVCQDCHRSGNPKKKDQYGERLIHERESLSEATRKIEQLERQIDEQHKQMRTLEQDIRMIATKTRQQTASLIKRKEEEHKRAINTIMEQNDSLKNRLSKIASMNLRHNDATITDLSDTMRPIKLAEEYTQLYDNEWTDAFDSLQKSRDEASIINYLLQIIEKAYEFCSQLAKRQQASYEHILLRPASFKLETTEQSAPLPQSSLGNEESMAFFELRKKFAGQSLADITKLFRDNHSGWFKGYQSSYTEKCLRQCWFMNIHSPPVVMDTLPKPGDHFNKDRYRGYNKDGPRVAYVVWPALYLHAGGPILVKGVAQAHK